MTDVPTRLARRLGLRDATVVGLGAMVGAGIFGAFSPAAQAAGSGLLIGLALAGAVAACNAASSARLAKRYPASGGTYVYGRERLGEAWGFLAGWAFISGKTASAAAMALVFGAHLSEDLARPVAVGAVLVLTAVNLRGVQRTVRATELILVVVFAALAAVVVAALFGGEADIDRLDGWWADGDLRDLLRSAGFLFFAFAGYARIATLGEEVRDPERTIPRAIMLALGVALAVYAVVALAALLTVGPETLAASRTPLVAAIEATSLDGLAPAVRVGAAIAAAGVLLSLLAGVSRTMFAMAADGNLPRPLAAVHATTRVPHVSELLVGILVAVAVALLDLRGAIGFSSALVLTYYGIANAAAITLPAEGRLLPRLVAVVGLVGCVTLALTLPGSSLLGGAVVLGAGLVVWLAWARAHATGARR